MLEAGSRSSPKESSAWGKLSRAQIPWDPLDIRGPVRLGAPRALLLRSCGILWIPAVGLGGDYGVQILGIPGDLLGGAGQIPNLLKGAWIPNFGGSERGAGGAK